MARTDIVQRVRIYLRRDDQWEGGLLYLAILEHLRRTGATGATALQGLAGFGPGMSARSPLRDLPDQHQPVVVEWIDRAERVERLLPTLADLIGETLVTVESIPVYQATLRARGPFTADHSVGDLMRRPAPAVSTETPLALVLALFVDERLGALPVVDALGLLAGLITTQELVWRAGLRLAPELLPALTAEEGAAVLAPLAGRTAQDVMSVEPRSVEVGTSIPQALVTMIEWGYPQIPVLQRDGRLVGLLEQEHVLREAVAQAAAQPEESAVRDAAAPTPVRLVMQTAAHQVTVGARLNVAMAQLLSAPDRRLLVISDDGRLVGSLSAARALHGLAGHERAAFLTALQRQQPTPATSLPGDDRSIESLIEADPPSISPQADILEAARRLLELGVERLTVVDERGALLGIIARGGLIRALMQQNE